MKTSEKLYALSKIAMLNITVFPANETSLYLPSGKQKVKTRDDIQAAGVGARLIASIRSSGAAYGYYATSIKGVVSQAYEEICGGGDDDR
jgi:hypothetical protein